MGDLTLFLMKLFACSLLVFILVAVVLARLTKKPFIFYLGNLFFLAAVAIIVWSFVIDDGSRSGWGFLALLILWGMAAGSFLIGFILRKIGASQSRKNALGDKNVVKTDDNEC